MGSVGGRGRTLGSRLGVLLAGLLVSCAGSGGSEQAGEAPTATELGNATYLGIEPQPLTLRDGLWQGEPAVPGGASRPRVALLPGFLLRGDLDGDGRPEAVALLVRSTGGSGSFLHLVVARRGPEGVEPLATTLLGDRVQLLRGGLEAAAIALELIEAGPGDAACCPSHKVLRRYALRDERLVAAGSEAQGRLSLDDLGGVEWRLVELDRGEAAPAAPAVTLRYRDGEIGGSSGCNRFFGSVRPADGPGSLVIGALGSTQRACEEPAMALEDHFLASLGAVRRFSFLAGRLALHSESGRGSTRLLFRRPEPGA